MIKVSTGTQRRNISKVGRICQINCHGMALTKVVLGALPCPPDELYIDGQRFEYRVLSDDLFATKSFHEKAG